MANSKRSLKIVLLLAVLVPALLATAKYFSPAHQSWEGVDEAVVEKVAKEHGRPSKPPLIDPGSGDLLLFVFLLAGAAGGFLAGYNWRELTKKPEP